MAFPILGTAQLGLPYGVANRTGQPDRKTSLAMLEAAVEEGVRSFDTASAYGESESILGAFIAAHGLESRVNVTTKVSIQEIRDDVDRAVNSSLRRLCVPSVDVLLIHSMPDKGSLPGLIERLEKCLADGRVNAIGVSVYRPEDALTVLQTPRLSVVQIPTNIFDHRFIKTGVLEMGIEQGKRVDVRSIFLQGLLALEPDALPPHLGEARGPLGTLKEIANRAGRTPLEIACSFVRDLAGVSGVLFGAETPRQIHANARWWRASGMPEAIRAEINAALACLPESVIDPRRWSAQKSARQI